MIIILSKYDCQTFTNIIDYNKLLFYKKLFSTHNVILLLLSLGNYIEKLITFFNLFSTCISECIFNNYLWFIKIMLKILLIFF